MHCVLFFIVANLVGVSIIMNVLTAFFVGSFVTKIEVKRNSENKRGKQKYVCEWQVAKMHKVVVTFPS